MEGREGDRLRPTLACMEADMEKKLYRSRKNRMISGVCGGLGEYTGIDPTWIRIGWAVLMLFTGAGIRETILFPLLKPEGH